MKERTLKVLARVQAVRETAARRRLEQSSREARESAEQADALNQERGQVLGQYAAGAMGELADRYADVLKAREEATREETVRRMAEREEARNEWLRVLMKSDILARHALSSTLGS